MITCLSLFFPSFVFHSPVCRLKLWNRAGALISRSEWPLCHCLGRGFFPPESGGRRKGKVFAAEKAVCTWLKLWQRKDDFLTENIMKCLFNQGLSVNFCILKKEEISAWVLVYIAFCFFNERCVGMTQLVSAVGILLTALYWCFSECDCLSFCTCWRVVKNRCRIFLLSPSFSTEEVKPGV